MKKKVTIIDYGVGNVYSVANALSMLDVQVKISSAALDLQKADALILPGVGAFDVAMRQLETSGLNQILNEIVLKEKKPILGICLGMQLLAKSSTENGFHQGLGWIDGVVEKLELSAPYIVPHVGWNSVTFNHNTALSARLTKHHEFYFDHSYHLNTAPDIIQATCWYGKDVTAAVQHENIFGVQFHPEKSQTSGLKLFKGFLNSIGQIPS
jgi:glutamine amidotransferase